MYLFYYWGGLVQCAFEYLNSFTWAILFIAAFSSSRITRTLLTAMLCFYFWNSYFRNTASTAVFITFTFSPITPLTVNYIEN